MQVFKAYLKIFKKLSPGIYMYLIIFLVLSVFLSGSGKQKEVSEFSKNKIKITVINEDQGELGEGLKSYLGNIHNLIELKNDKEVLQDQLYYRNVEYILFIPNDFTSKLKANDWNHLCENVKVPGSFSGRYLDNQVNQYISTLNAYMISGVNEKQAIMNANKDLAKEVKVDLLNKTVSTEKAPDYYYFKYLCYILISVVIMGIGPILAVFHSKEINQRNLCSAMPLQIKNKGLLFGSIVIVLGMFSVFLLFAFLLYGKNMDMQKMFLYILNCMAFLLVTTGIGYLVSIFTSSTNVLNMISNICGLGMSFLCGVFVPREVLGENVLAFAKFLPVYWYVNAVDAIQEVGNMTSVRKDLVIAILIEVLFAVAIFAVALVVSRLKSDARKQIA